MKKLFWERSLDSVAIGLVSLFIPIYLLRLDYSLTEVFVFFGLSGLAMTLLTPFAIKSIARFGANRTMVLGNLFNVVFFLLLFALPSLYQPLWLLAIFRAGYSTFYFPAFTANFVKSRARNKTGTQIGKLNAITLLFHGIAPAIGGIVASTLGFNWVYGVVVCLIVIANIPLLFGRDDFAPTKFSIKKIPWNAYRDFVANGLYNVPIIIESIIWPIAISLFIASYATIGFLSSIMIFTSMGISLYVGRREDSIGERRYIKQGIFSGILGNFGRMFVTTPVGVLGVNFLSGTSGALLANSFTSRYYKNADTDRLMEYIFGMEIAHSIVWAVFFGLLAVASIFMSTQFVLILAILLSIPATYGVKLIKD